MIVVDQSIAKAFEKCNNEEAFLAFYCHLLQTPTGFTNEYPISDQSTVCRLQ